LAALLPSGAQERFRVASSQGALDGLVAGSEQAISLGAELLQQVRGTRIAIAPGLAELLVVESLKKAHLSILLVNLAGSQHIIGSQGIIGS
jgi:hypothetical protein